jgi:hypothetical protein
MQFFFEGGSLGTILVVLLLEDDSRLLVSPDGTLRPSETSDFSRIQVGPVLAPLLGGEISPRIQPGEVSLTTVPEPSAALLVALGSGLLFKRKRKHSVS